MHARFVLIAAATLVSTAAVAAEPAKPAPSPQIAAPQAPVRVVLASADDLRSPVSTEQQAPSPPKRPRIARVTTCRCADQPAQPEQ